MNKTRVMMIGLCVVALAAQVSGQSRKAGLWEVTTNTSMSGGPPSMSQMPARTSQVCVTQAMIDKYGGPYSNPQRGNCQATNVVLTATGMTANMTCSGGMSGTVQTTFVDANTTKTTVQVSMPMGPNTMNMTIQSTATYKGADCGSVQPLPMPASQ